MLLDAGTLSNGIYQIGIRMNDNTTIYKRMVIQK
jgi:hypothetical protein